MALSSLRIVDAFSSLKKKKTNTAACNETEVLVGAKLNLAILSELNVCFVVR